MLLHLGFVNGDRITMIGTLSNGCIFTYRYEIKFRDLGVFLTTKQPFLLMYCINLYIVLYLLLLGVNIAKY